MSLHKIVISAAVAVSCGALLCLSSAGGDSKKKEEKGTAGPTRQEWIELRKDTTRVIAESKKLSDDLSQLRKDHKALLDDHKNLLDKLRADTDKNKADAEKKIAALQQNQDEKLLVKWMWSGSLGRTGDDGATFTVDFTKVAPGAKKVVEAMAVPNHFNLSYGRDDHHVQTLRLSANVEKVEGTKVTVRYRASMHDNSRHSGGGGGEVVVIAHVVMK